MDISGITALVTGAASGLGATTTAELAGRGAIVHAASTSTSRSQTRRRPPGSRCMLPT